MKHYASRGCWDARALADLAQIASSYILQAFQAPCKAVTVRSAGEDIRNCQLSVSIEVGA
jgi:hypothetical protein